MTMTFDDIRLTVEHVARFQEQGYLSLDRLVEAEEIAWVREIYDRLFANRVGWDRGEQFDLAGTDDPGVTPRLPQLMNPASHAPELQKAAFRQAAFEIARQLLGPDAQRGDEHAICKPAADGAATPWHQDQAYWDPAFAYEALSIWVPLQEATLLNGCMQFIPDSHHGEILSHHSIGRDVRVHGLETDEADPRRRLPCRWPPAAARSIIAARCTMPAPTAAASRGGPTSSPSATRPCGSTRPAISPGSPPAAPPDKNARDNQRW